MIARVQDSTNSNSSWIAQEWSQGRVVLFAVALLSVIIQLSKMISCDILCQWGYFCLFGVFTLCCRDFNKLIIMLPLSLLTMGQAPPSFGIGEYYFSILFVAVFINLMCILKSKIFKLTVGEWIFFGLLGTFLVVNFMVALKNGASSYDWFRAIIPFFICLLYKPLQYFLTHAENSVKNLFFTSLLITFSLFSIQVISYYLYFDLYHLQYHVYDSGLEKMLIISQEKMGSFDANNVFYYLTRVTVILDEATSPFIILGCIFGQLIYVWAREKYLKYAGLFLIFISTVGFVLTNTRTLFLIFFVIYGVTVFIISALTP